MLLYMWSCCSIKCGVCRVVLFITKGPWHDVCLQQYYSVGGVCSVVFAVGLVYGLTHTFVWAWLWPTGLSAVARKVLRTRLTFNPLNAKLNPICHLLALLGAHHILHVSRIRVKLILFVVPSVSGFIHSFIPLACAECNDSLQFLGDSSIPLCYVLFPATLLHQLFFHPLSPHFANCFLVYLSILLFPIHI